MQRAGKPTKQAKQARQASKQASKQASMIKAEQTNANVKKHALPEWQTSRKPLKPKSCPTRNMRSYLMAHPEGRRKTAEMGRWQIIRRRLLTHKHLVNTGPQWSTSRSGRAKVFRSKAKRLNLCGASTNSELGNPQRTSWGYVSLKDQS